MLKAAIARPPLIARGFVLTGRLPADMAASHCAARVGWMENLGSRLRSDGRNRLAVPDQLYYLVPGEFAQPYTTSGSRSGTAVAVHHWPRFMQLMIIPRRLRSNFAFNELTRFGGPAGAAR